MMVNKKIGFSLTDFSVSANEKPAFYIFSL